MAGKKKGSGPQTITQSNTPWEGQAGHLATLYSMASQQAKKPQQQYAGSTVADFSPETEEALQGITSRAQQGSDIDRAAQKNIQDTLSGSYLSGPQFQRSFDTAARDIMPRVTSSFGAMGRGRGGAVANSLTRSLGDAYVNLQNQERQNMMAASQLAPQMSQLDYTNLARLGSVGQIRENLQRELMAEKKSQFDEQQEEPWKRLQRYSNIIHGAGIVPGSSSQTTPGQKGASRLSGAIGGGMQGAQMGGAVGGPWGAVAGGIGGGLLGAFS